MNALTLRQIADITKLSIETLKSRVRREQWRWAGETVINHKPTRMFDPAALPEDIRLKLEPASTQPVVSLPRPVVVPEQGRKIALARFDLLRHWQAWRVAHPGNIAKADAEFMAGYESRAFPQLRLILREVSIKTLYRWKKELGDSTDWNLLVPNYYTKGNGGQPMLPAEVAGVFMKYLLQPSKINIGSAYRITVDLLKAKPVACELPSESSFRRYAEHFKRTHYDIWVHRREGDKALKDKVLPYVTRDISRMQVGEVLIADGTRLNFMIRDPRTGKPIRAILVGYLDWKSHYLAGYEIMAEENTQCIAAALRNAILHLGKIPEICYQDNGKAFRSKFFTDKTNFDECGIFGLFARLGIDARFTKPYNGRSKPIEIYWKGFDNTFQRLMPSYTGSSIADKPAYCLRDEPWHKARHDEFIPELYQVYACIAKWLEFAGNMPCPHVPGKTRKQVFDEGRGPGVDEAELDDLMMGIAVKKIGRNGIRLFNEYYYSDELYGSKEQVLVRYDLQTRDYVKVYTTSGGFLCKALRGEPLLPFADKGTREDMDKLHNALSLQKRLAKQTRATGELESIDVEWARPQIYVDAKAQYKTLPALESVTQADSPAPAEVHIPEEAVTVPAHHEAAPSPDGRPLFPDSYSRFQWHLANGCHTEEDKLWVADYKKSREYAMLFTGNEA